MRSGERGLCGTGDGHFRKLACAWVRMLLQRGCAVAVLLSRAQSDRLIHGAAGDGAAVLDASRLRACASAIRGDEML